MKKTLMVITLIVVAIALPELLGDTGWWVETPSYEIESVLL